MPTLTFENVTKRYADGTVAVRELDLEVPDGALGVLVGPSGCGKTSLLRMLAGLESISGGSIRVGDREINDVPAKERDVAMVFQNYALYPHMTVYDNMAFSLKLRHVKKAEIHDRVMKVAAVLGLEDQLPKRPRNLSGGQRQRVAMGRAMVREPQAFLMDEPLSNLDAKLRVHMRAEIGRLQRDLGVTTLYVTHDQTEAITLGDLVAVMRHGVIQQLDSPQVLYRTPANLFVAGFIGSPAMNLVEADLTSDASGAVHAEFGGHRLLLDPALLDARPTLRKHVGGRVILGIRPEHLREAERGEVPQDRSIVAVAEMLEEFGSETYLYFDVDAPPIASDEVKEIAADTDTAMVDTLMAQANKTRFIARVSAETPIREGDRCALLVDPTQLHFFDPDTGTAIRSRA